MPAGRPKKDIDWKTVADLAMIQCTHEEIAHVMRISRKTLTSYPEFLTIYKEGKETGRKSLRRAQYKKAMDGNPTMLIWLGKQYLGQTDKQEITDATAPMQMLLEACGVGANTEPNERSEQ